MVSSSFILPAGGDTKPSTNVTVFNATAGRDTKPFIYVPTVSKTFTTNTNKNSADFIDKDDRVPNHHNNKNADKNNNKKSGATVPLQK